MTTRLKGFTVFLEKEMREDDAEATRAAILQIRGVMAAEPIESTPSEDFAIYAAKNDLLKQIGAILK